LNIDLSEADFIKTSVVLLATFSVEQFFSFSMLEEQTQ